MDGTPDERGILHFLLTGKKEHYLIEVGEGILFDEDESSLLARFQQEGIDRYALITDHNVKREWGDAFSKFLIRQGLEVSVLSIEPGEHSKTLQTAEKLANQLAEHHCSRDSMIIGLGGGVVGDLAGFVASSYMRGIPYIHAPTSLLAQVDSSIGGKTGVNLEAGKNLFGSFHQPHAVLTDISTLTTLPEKEIRNGLAELVKYGMMLDQELFEYLERTAKTRHAEVFTEWVSRGITAKGTIVKQDESEQGIRAVLNYGHTIGHAIEADSGFQIPHGSAIAIGMVYEGMIAVKQGILNECLWKRQNELIAKIGLPLVYLNEPRHMLARMRRDKKNKGGDIHIVLPKSIGAAHQVNKEYTSPVSEELILECLQTPINK